MDIKEFAQSINGRQYPFQLTIEERNNAYLNDFVVLYGESDDLLSVEGLFNDEISVMRSGTIRKINKSGFIPDWNSIDHSEYEDAKKCILGESQPCIEIKCLWCNSNVPWEYEIDFPHETFTIFEDDELFCVGAVIDMKLLKSKEELFGQNVVDKAMKDLDELCTQKEKDIQAMTIDEVVEFLTRNIDFLAFPVLKILENCGKINNAESARERLKNNASQLVRDVIVG